MTDKMREEFEVAYQAACLNRAVARFHPSVFAKDHCEDYLSSLVQSAWWGWQASRTAVVVELPPMPDAPEEPEEAIDDSHMDAYHSAIGMRHACAQFIKAAGLKVTP